eukprot:TRINITY_DN215_c0_g5_i1.p1 TRINITY_DN215_c0_g5~~TRINITY_DN215_c0_g5_i1.p1  ORF type:complete len:374 (+),score=83.82 TRINITY_DN215_c0_g5_i1:160-1281(+)
MATKDIAQTPRFKSFCELLLDPVRSMHFLRYLEKQFSAENLYFYFDIETYKKVCLVKTSAEKDKLAFDIYHKYFDPNSPYELNVPAYDREIVEQKLNAEQIDATLYDVLQDQIFLILVMDHFPKFVTEEKNIVAEVQERVSQELMKEMYFAVKAGNVQRVQTLVKQFHGGDINIPANFERFQRTWLHIAAGEGHYELVRKLLEWGSKIDCKSSNGWTPLHEAAFAGHTTICAVLLSKGADPVALSNDSTLPLFYFVVHDFKDSEKEIFNQLFDRLSKNVINHKNNRNETALHYAARGTDLTLSVSALLAKGASVSIGDKRGNTALHYAVMKNNLGVVKLLLQAGADPSVKSSAGTCFDLAKGKQQLLDLLEGK